MADVFVKYSELKELDDYLKNIITELNECSNRAEELEHAISNPYGKDDLRDAAKEFEEGWDDRRNDLARDLAKVQEHVAGVVKGFEEWDDDTANKLDQNSGSGPSSPSGPR